MATGKTANLDLRVQAYMKSWVTEVSQKLQANKARLMMCTPCERAGIKSKIHTLSVVLEHLEGKREIQIQCEGEAAMKEEIATLKKRLEESEIKHKDLTNKVRVSNKIIGDLKRQLEKARKKQIQSREVESSVKNLNQKLKEVQCSSAAMLSVETAINRDLTSKLEDAKKQLQQPLRLAHSAAEVPTDVSELLLHLQKSTEELEKHARSMQSSQQQDEAAGSDVEEALQEVIRGMDLCTKLREAQVKVMEKVQEFVPAAETGRSVQSTDTPVSELQKKAPEKEEEEPKPDLHDEEENVVCFTINQLKTHFNNLASEAWKEQKAKLRMQRVEIAKLTAAVRHAEEQLEVQRQESAKVLQGKEQEWVQTLEEMSKFKEKATKRPRRRNWFLRMFTSAS
eukprot:superscaffoldBa00005151_g19973